MPRPPAPPARASRGSENPPAPIDEIRLRLEGVKASPAYRAHCPCHSDPERSLLLWEDLEGWCHVVCEIGCSAEDVLRALDLAPWTVAPPFGTAVSRGHG